jgi:hypothetical protein
MSLNNKIFCTAPFSSMRIESQQQEVTYKPGCVYMPVGSISSIDDFLSGKEMTEHRDNLCNGTVPSPGCFKCSHSESLNLNSTRMFLNKSLGKSDNLSIRLLDIFFSNTCNLSCVMCSPDASSSLANERHNIGFLDKLPSYVDNTANALEAMDRLTELETVTFIGGEFFIFKNNLVLLDKIIERSLGCRIVTNATVILDLHLEKMRSIKDLHVQISIDAVGPAYEFMRYPASWATVEKNIFRLKRELPHAKFNFNMVVQPLNILHCIKTLEVLNCFTIPTRLTNLVTPEHLSWTILDINEKSLIINYINDNLNNAKITYNQKEEIEKFISSLSNVNFDIDKRSMGINLLKKTYQHRKLSNEIIKNHFGILHNIANEIIKE